MKKKYEDQPNLGKLIRDYNAGKMMTNWEKARVHGHQRVKGNAERHARGIGDSPKPLVATLTRRVAEIPESNVPN